MRILFATTRGAGHFNPLVPFIDAALREGHEVLVAGPDVLAETVERAGYPFWRCDAPPEHLLGPTWGRVQSAATPEEADAIVIGEIFGRLNVQAALPRVREACDEWRPHLCCGKGRSSPPRSPPRPPRSPTRGWGSHSHPPSGT